MNKETFLLALYDELRGLPVEDKERSIAYYREMIDERVEDGMSEEEDVAALGSVEDIAAVILGSAPATVHAREKTRGGRPRLLGIVLVALLAVCALALVLSWLRAERGNYTEREYSVFMAGITQIVLEESNADVTVIRNGMKPGVSGSSSDIVVVYQDGAGSALEITNHNGVLTVKRRDRIRPFSLWGGGDLHTELWLPRGLNAELSVETNNGSIAAEGLFLRGDAAFSSDNGAITVKDTHVDGLELDSDNGKIEASNVDCTSFEAEASNGRVTLSDISAETTLHAKTSNGAIMVDNVAAGKSVELRSSNGSIKGTLAGSDGDYRIESKTTNGANNLPDSWGKGDILLTVETTNGAIDIQFEEG